MIDAKDLGRQPAYPMTYTDNGCDLVVYHPGITLRQHFAGLAMQALLINYGRMENVSVSSCYAEIAQESAEHAYALIAELAKAQP